MDAVDHRLVLRSNVPRALRHLRRRRRWRQADLALRAGTSRQTISRIERGELRGVPIGVLAAAVEALAGTIDLTLRWQGEQLDRLFDAAHAWLEEATASYLGECGWLVKSEVSFNHYGDRGRVDVLAFHPSVRTILVVEVKSGIGDVQELLGRHDVKVRLARGLAQSLGWAPAAAVVPLLVIGDSRRSRRVVGSHQALFGRYALRGRAARAWLRGPRVAAATPPPTGLLWFTSVPDSHGMGVTRERRVRSARSEG